MVQKAGLVVAFCDHQGNFGDIGAGLFISADDADSRGAKGRTLPVEPEGWFHREVLVKADSAGGSSPLQDGQGVGGS